MASSHRAPFSETIMLNQSLQRQSLFSQIPSLIKGAELREKIEVFPILSNIVGQKNALGDLKNKMQYWDTRKDPSYIIAGAHGTGKKALAKAAIRAYVEKRGAVLFNLTPATIDAATGAGRAKKIQDLFTVAELNRPSVVYIPRLQDFFHKGMRPDDPTAAELQRQIHRLEKCYGVLILGITTHPELLHEIAFQRFTRIIYCPPPSPEERAELVKIRLEERYTNITREQYKTLGELTKGYNRTDIVEVVFDVLEMIKKQKNSQGKPLITFHHFRDAITIKKKGQLDTAGDKRVRNYLTRVGGVIIY